MYNLKKSFQRLVLTTNPPFPFFSCRPTIRFRNYTPRDISLGDVVTLTRAELPSEAAAVSRAAETARLEAIDNTTDSSTADAVIVPKKANWDLKRDLAPKKAKLDRLTQRAIAEILRTRLTTTTGVAAVNNGAGGGGVGGGVAVDLDAQVDGAVAAVLARSLAHSDESLRDD